MPGCDAYTNEKGEFEIIIKDYRTSRELGRLKVQIPELDTEEEATKRYPLSIDFIEGELR